MSNLAGERLTKITLNLYANDVEWFRKRYGWGYSEHIRDIVRNEKNRIQRQMQGEPGDE